MSKVIEPKDVELISIRSDFPMEFMSNTYEIKLFGEEEPYLVSGESFSNAIENLINKLNGYEIPEHARDIIQRNK